MDKPITVGIVGGGNIATQVHIPLLSCFKDISLSYVADIREPRGNFPTGTKKIQVDPHTISSLPFTDIVLLATPVGAREAYIHEFCKRDTLLFTEKPFATNTISHEAYLHLSPNIVCNYMRRNYSSIRQLQEIISSQIFGNLKHVIIVEGGIVGKTKKGKAHYQMNPQLSGGGILMESGCHTLSQLTFLLSDYRFTLLSRDVQKQDHFDVDVTANFRAQKKDHAVLVELSFSLIKPCKTESRYIFDSAEIRFNHVDASSPLAIFSRGKNFPSQRPLHIISDQRWATTFYQAFYLQWQHCFDLLRKQEPFDTAQETSLMTTKLIDAIYRKGASL
jgi:predicted dehydrogenase